MIVDNLADISILVVLLFSTALSVMRGFFKESLILSSTIISIVLAYHYGAAVGQMCTFVQSVYLQNLIGGFLLFILVSFASSLLRYFVLKLFNSGASPLMDRIIGAAYGFVRGSFIVTILVVLMASTPIVEQDIWLESKLIPVCQNIAAKSQERLPYNLKNKVSGLLEDMTLS